MFAWCTHTHTYRCPDALSFICNIQDLLDEAVNALTRALGLGTIDEWIEALFRAVNFPNLKIDLGPFDLLATRLLNGIFADKFDLLESELRKLKTITELR